MIEITDEEMEFIEILRKASDEDREEAKKISRRKFIGG